jgi:hypothetical protein
MTDVTLPESPEVPEEKSAPEIPEAAAPETDPPKKRRGRPPKNPQLQQETVTPGAKAKPGPKAKKTIYGSDEIGIMGRQLVGVHQIVAMVTGIPEIVIQEPEANLLAQSVANVANEYGLEIDGKTGASIQLFMTVAMIYGPRFLQFRARSKQAQQNAQSQHVELAPS